MMVAGSWLVWYVGSALVAALGSAAILFGVLWDRSRGRARCPKCWYDMSTQAAAGCLVCPECGRDARRTARLHRTRRNCRLICGGAVVLLAAVGGAATPMLRSEGWARSAPTTVLLFFIPRVEAKTDQAHAELTRRAKLDARWSGSSEDQPHLELWGWQRSLLVNRCAAALEKDRSKAAKLLSLDLLALSGGEAAAAVEAICPLLASPDEMMKWRAANTLAEIGAPGKAAADDLATMLSRDPHDPPWHAASAIRALTSYGGDAAVATPALTALLEAHLQQTGGNRSPWQELGVGCVGALASIGPEAAPAVPLLLRVLAEGSGHERAAAVRAIHEIDWSAPGCAEAVANAVRDPDVDVRRAVSEVLQARPMPREAIVRDLAVELQSDSRTERVAAARGLFSLGRDAAPAERSLWSALADEEPIVRLFALQALASLDSFNRLDPKIAELRDDPDATVRRAAAQLAGHQLQHSKGK